MLNLMRQTSWYFETCRQIIWARLSYDKLFILYSDDARSELSKIWEAAIARTIGRTMFSEPADVLDTALQQDDAEWDRFLRVIERQLAMQDIIDDYFLGDSADELVNDIEGGGYRAGGMD